MKKMLLSLEFRKIGYSTFLAFDNLLMFLDLNKFGFKLLSLLTTSLLLILIAIRANIFDDLIVINIEVDRTIIMLKF